MYISKRSGMDHTVLPANTPRLPVKVPNGVENLPKISTG